MAGIIAAYGSIEELNINKMLHKINHRGPDVSFKLDFDKIIIGEAFLSLNSEKPSSFDTKSNYAVIDGRIFNHLQFVEEFGIFDSNRTLVIKLYEKYDKNFLTKLDGMFAMVIVMEKNSFLLPETRLVLNPYTMDIRVKQLFLLQK